MYYISINGLYTILNVKTSVVIIPKPRDRRVLSSKRILHGHKHWKSLNRLRNLVMIFERNSTLRTTD
jgi:hypothetical protein